MAKPASHIQPSLEQASDGVSVAPGHSPPVRLEGFPKLIQPRHQIPHQSHELYHTAVCSCLLFFGFQHVASKKPFHHIEPVTVQASRLCFGQCDALGYLGHQQPCSSDYLIKCSDLPFLSPLGQKRCTMCIFKSNRCKSFIRPCHRPFSTARCYIC